MSLRGDLATKQSTSCLEYFRIMDCHAHQLAMTEEYGLLRQFIYIIKHVILSNLGLKLYMILKITEK
ncbi:MAG: hypothetical protein LBJ88_03630 [Campylobacteraceae bacterium]|nr:hypothetical protein [Campylobacteraceae bacterium]